MKQCHSTGIVGIEILPGNFPDETQEVKMILGVAQAFTPTHRCLIRAVLQLSAKIMTKFYKTFVCCQLYNNIAAMF